MKKLFDLGIGYDEETGKYCAIVNSLTDRKTVAISDPNIRVVISKVSRRIRQKSKEIKCFPLEGKPEPSLIIQCNGNGSLKGLIPQVPPSSFVRG